jgi:hypothetical protein
LARPIRINISNLNLLPWNQPRAHSVKPGHHSIRQLIQNNLIGPSYGFDFPFTIHNAALLRSANQRWK